MKNKISFFLSTAFLVSLLSVLIFGCKKDKVVTANTEVAFFSVPGPSATYRISTPTTIYKIPVGLTKIPEGTRTVNVTVTTTTGATVGTHYTINKTSFTFDSKKVADTIVITGVQSQYLLGRKDTLKFSFTNTSDGIPSLFNTFTLAIRGPCLEEDVTSAFVDMLGTYTKTFENGSYGPYQSTITAATGVGATSAKATINNIYESSISAVATFTYSAAPGPFSINMDPTQTQYTNGGLPMFIKSSAPGSFVYCAQTLRLPLTLYTSAGTVDTWVTTMAR